MLTLPIVAFWHRVVVLAVSMLLLVGFVAAMPGAATGQVPGRWLAIVGATVIDGTGGPVRPNTTILIQGSEIAALGPADDMQVPTEATVIDGAGKWVIPGLIDAQIHFFQSGGLYARPDLIDLRHVRPYEDELVQARERVPETFARYIASGITGVIDQGGPFWTFDVRALAARIPRAPGVAVSGTLLAGNAPAELLGGDDPPLHQVRTPEQAAEAVDRLLPYEPDLIKLWLVDVAPWDDNELAWVRAAIGAARAAGKRVAAHVTSPTVAAAVVAEGIDILIHAVGDETFDDALLEDIRNGGIIYITGLAVDERYRQVFGRHLQITEMERRIADPDALASLDDLASLPPDDVPSWVRPRDPRPLDPIAAETMRRIRDAGITIAAGSAAGNIGSFHGPALHRELELMVKAGLSPMEALVAATRGGAAAMGRHDELGTVAAGRFADLVILDADPLSDIASTRSIHRVIKAGLVYDPHEILADLP